MQRREPGESIISCCNSIVRKSRDGGWSKLSAGSLRRDHSHVLVWPLYPSGVSQKGLGSRLVSQTTPFAERGRVWSSCNYRVVAEEHNY